MWYDLLFMLICAIGIYAWSVSLVVDMFNKRPLYILLDAIALSFLMFYFYALLWEVTNALTNT